MATPPNSAEPSSDARAVARAEFVSLLSTHGDAIPLTEAAAWMCAEERGVDTISPIMDAVAALSDPLYIPEGTPVIEAVARLNHHLFETLAFRGDQDTYGHPDNSLLDSVLSNRKGIPITLSLVTMAVAESVGIKMHGIGFPTHFLVSPAASLPRFFVDPFYQGRVLTADHLEPWFARISSQTGGRMPPLTWWLKPVSARQILSDEQQPPGGLFEPARPGGRPALRGATLGAHPRGHRSPTGPRPAPNRAGQEEEGAKDLDGYLAARRFENALSD